MDKNTTATPQAVIAAGTAALVLLPYAHGGGRAMVVQARDGGLVPIYEGPLSGGRLAQRTQSGCAGYLRALLARLRAGANADDFTVVETITKAIAAFVYPDALAFAAECVRAGTLWGEGVPEEFRRLCAELLRFEELPALLGDKGEALLAGIQILANPPSGLNE